MKKTLTPRIISAVFALFLFALSFSFVSATDWSSEDSTTFSFFGSGVVTDCSQRSQTECENQINDAIREAIYNQVAGAWSSSDLDPEDFHFCDASNPGSYDFETPDGECISLQDCGCEWKTINEQEGCYGAYAFQSDPDCGNPGVEETYKCRFTSNLVNTCSTDGLVTLHVSATLWKVIDGIEQPSPLPDDASRGCIDTDKTYPCPTSGSPLPFFTFFNFALATIAIFGIYYLSSKKRK